MHNGRRQLFAMVMIVVGLLGGLGGLPLAARAHMQQTQPHLVAQALVPLPYLKTSNTEAGDAFGYSMALSADGSTLVVGAPGEASSATGGPSDNTALDAGAAYVFVRSGCGWVQQAMLKASNAEADDRFGTGVAISGDTIVVGAPDESSSATGGPSDNSADSAGAAYVFVRSGTTWSQQALLKASNVGVRDYFGQSVAISGDTIVVGAHYEASSATGGPNDNSASGAGAAYVFTRSATTWSQQAFLKASNAEAGDQFGASVALSADGSTLVVGARLEDSSATGGPNDNSVQDAGAAYVFGRSGSVWVQQAMLKASSARVSDYFGQSVAISGATIVVGAPSDDISATGISDNSTKDSGAVYVFGRSSTTWSEQARLKASSAGARDYFGQSIAISGDRLVVGAYAEDSSAMGAPNSVEDAGAAYVFTRSGTTWAQQAFLKASNAGANDFFGQSVAVSDDTVMVGAYGESSSATGDPTDNTAQDAGAVYPFGSLRCLYMPLVQRN